MTTDGSRPPVEPVAGRRLPDCVLCAPETSAVWEDARLRVIRVADADYPGFCRVIWQDHVVEMSDLSATDRAHLLDVLCLVEQVVRRTMRCDKINLASFGNQVPHLHWHVIPRFTDDAHFPQPVWAAPVRVVAPRTLAERAERAARLTPELKIRLDDAFVGT